MEIHSNSYSLDMLLSDFPKFTIPELQRPYAWGEAQVRDFVNDVATLVEVLNADPMSTSEHLFGMVVSIGGANGPQSVVDGQQRLTTTTMALGVLRACFLELAEEQQGGPQDAIAQQCQVRAVNLRNLLMGDAGAEGMPRLLTSTEIQLTYESLVTGGNGLVAEENLQPAVKLRQAAKIVRNELMKNGERFDLFGAAKVLAHLLAVEKVLLKRLKFIHVRTTSPEAGYGLFETLNTRGQRLNALDLVKVWIMSQLAGKPTEVMVAKQFRGLANDDTDVELRYLRDYFRAQAFRSPDETNEVTFSQDVRKYIFKDPTITEVEHVLESEALILSHVDRMQDWFDAWVRLTKVRLPYPVPKDADAMTLFGQERLDQLLSGVLRHTLPMPLLMHLAATKDVATFAKTVHQLERFFFRYRTVCNGAVGPMEKVYLDWCSRLAAQPKAPLTKFSTSLNTLLTEYAGNDKFASMLPLRIEGSGAAALKRVRYMLQMLDRYEMNGEPWACGPEGQHVIAISDDPGSFDTPDEVTRLGNLMLVTDPEKKLLNGKPFKEKKALIATLKGGLRSPTAAAAMKASVWDSKAAAANEAHLVKLALSTFSV